MPREKDREPTPCPEDLQCLLYLVPHRKKAVPIKPMGYKAAITIGQRNERKIKVLKPVKSSHTTTKCNHNTGTRATNKTLNLGR